MRALLKRREPVIAFGDAEPVSELQAAPAPAPAADDAPVRKGVVRTRRRAPTGDLTRTIRKEQSKGALDRIRQSLSLASDTFEAVTMELLAAGGDLTDEGTILAALNTLFDCEPIGGMTAHPVVMVGASPEARMRAALALTQRIERTGRRVALYELEEGRPGDPLATYRGGVDILHVGSTEACLDAVRVKEPADMAIVSASCLDAAADDARALAMMALGINAEIVYVHGEGVPLPEPEMLSGIQRLVLTGRLSGPSFGAALNAAYRHRWAFAGHAMASGVYHPATPALLADRFVLGVR